MKMKETSSHLALASAACLVMLATVPVRAGEVTPALQRGMAHKGTHADTAVIVRFTNPVDVQALTTGERQERSEPLLLALKERAARHRAAIQPALQEQGAVKVRDLWLINAVALTVPAVAVKALAALDGVATVDLDAFVQGGRSQRTPPAQCPWRDPGCRGPRQRLTHLHLISNRPNQAGTSPVSMRLNFGQWVILARAWWWPPWIRGGCRAATCAVSGVGPTAGSTRTARSLIHTMHWATVLNHWASYWATGYRRSSTSPVDRRAPF